MPYIDKDRRVRLASLVKVFEKKINYETPIGDLAYLITQLLLTTDPQSFSSYNALVGVLECVKLEFYRRAVARYEEDKLLENGDVGYEKYES